MPKPLVLMLTNEPLLPKDHPAAESEHTVLEVAARQTQTLTEEGYRVNQLRIGNDPTVLWHEFNVRRPDVVFNLYEGKVDQPETESYVAGLMDWAGVPYTGCPFATLTIARAKHVAKYILKGAGVPTADFYVVNQLPAPECRLRFPVIVKAALMDASVGMDQGSVCVDAQQLQKRVEYVLATYGAPVLVEEFVDGREFHVALMELPELRAMPPSETIFPKRGPGYWSIVTYEAKWKVGTPDYDETPPVFPADLPPELAQTLSQHAERAYRLLGCRDYARVDFRMNAHGEPFVLEINPNPQICEDNSFTECFRSVHVTYREFIVRLVEQALSRGNVAQRSAS